MRDKQLAVIADMQKANEEAKAIDQKLVDKIDESVQSIKTEMFEAWQETVRDALVAETKALVENKLSEYDTIYRKQNEVIGAQAKLIDKLTTSYRFMKLLCSALVIVAILVFAVIPTGQYAFEEIGKFLSEPTWWGGVVLAAAVILLSLAVALAVLLRRKEAKK